jgi:cob(I)alamin adenosyltransferase
MKIYTKTGDKGTTSLIGGKRVPKNHIRIEAYGTADELIAHMAYLRDSISEKEHRDFLLLLLDDLMVVSSILATDDKEFFEKLPKLSAQSAVKIESEIDRLEKKLTPLKSFVIPGGHPVVSACHIVRTVCRRCERMVYSLNEVNEVPNIILVYLNRLSDYLFVLARVLAVERQIKDIIWKPKLD